MNFIKNFKDYLTESIFDYEDTKYEPMQSVEIVDIEDGIYDAIIGGYNVRIIGTDISFKTNTGVRCTNCPCTISVINKKAYVKL